MPDRRRRKEWSWRSKHVPTAYIVNGPSRARSIFLTIGTACTMATACDARGWLAIETRTRVAFRVPLWVLGAHLGGTSERRRRQRRPASHGTFVGRSSTPITIGGRRPPLIGSTGRR